MVPRLRGQDLLFGGAETLDFAPSSNKISDYTYVHEIQDDLKLEFVYYTLTCFGCQVIVVEICNLLISSNN